MNEDVSDNGMKNVRKFVKSDLQTCIDVCMRAWHDTKPTSGIAAATEEAVDENLNN